MAELQQSVVTDQDTRHQIQTQILQWEENLERLHCEQFRLRCYMASLQGGELPNPKVCWIYLFSFLVSIHIFIGQPPIFFWITTVTAFSYLNLDIPFYFDLFIYLVLRCYSFFLLSWIQSFISKMYASICWNCASIQIVEI